MDKLLAIIDRIIVLWIFIVPVAFKKLKAWHDADEYNPGPGVAGIFGGAFVAITSVWALGVVLNIWRWIGIFEPKLWLVKRILGL